MIAIAWVTVVKVWTKRGLKPDLLLLQWYTDVSFLQVIGENKTINGPSSQGYGFLWSCMDVRAGLWRRLSAEELMFLNCGVGEDSRVPWTARRSNQSILKEISPGISLEGMMLKLKLWPPHAKSWLIGKDSDAGRDWGREDKGTTEDEMAGWHHWLDGRESEWTPGVGDGQRGLACCDSWGRKESDTTERLNWTELIFQLTSLQIQYSLAFL